MQTGVIKKNLLVDFDAMDRGILSAIGNTPLVRLPHLTQRDDLHIYAKIEYLNPAGSIKDRPAFHMVQKAIGTGQINKQTTIIEASSGNLGIGLAQVCAYLGLRFICVLPITATKTNLNILRIYGAEVVVVKRPDPQTGEFLQACITVVEQICHQHTNVYWPDQHNNLSNPASHRQTMSEIDKALDGKVDFLFCATSTCGTLRGCSEYAAEAGLNTFITAVDMEGSVIFGSARKKRFIPGHGAGKVPGIFKEGLVDEVVHVTPKESVWGCFCLLRREAIFAGASSGGVAAALIKKAPQIPSGSNVVMIVCDNGERYLDTIYNLKWIAENISPETDFIKQVHL